jgi:hypothetical protein
LGHVMLPFCTLGHFMLPQPLQLEFFANPKSA